MLVLDPLHAGLDHAQREERRRRRELGHGRDCGFLVALRRIGYSFQWHGLVYNEHTDRVFRVLLFPERVHPSSD